MTDKSEALLKRPLYVYDLPPELLSTLETKHDARAQQEARLEASPKASSSSEQIAPATSETAKAGSQTPAGSASCALCNASFASAAEQRQHVKSDWHGYNLKQRMRGAGSVAEPEFERLLEDLNESISGSESSSLSSSSGDEGERQAGGDGTRLAVLLQQQAKVVDEAQGGHEGSFVGRKQKGGSGGSGGGAPMLWFSSSLLPTNTSLGVYKALFSKEEQQNPVAALVRKQLEPSKGVKAPKQAGNDGQPTAEPTGPSVLICMIGGGHFAAMIVSLTPEITKSKGVSERKATTIAQKTFHRYTTRRKQGGAQSSNDNAKGNANSAGAAIRRANEAALEKDVRTLLQDWSELVAGCELLFVRATGTVNRRVLFGAHDGQVLRSTDPRLRSIPFSTRRATQQECMRAFVELTRVKVSHIDEAALAAAAEASNAGAAALTVEKRASKQNTGPVVTKTKNELSPEMEEAMLHTGQLQALMRRSKIPAMLSYLASNSLQPDFNFQPAASQANHHAPTPLHLAASLNSPLLVHALLVKAGANPAAANGEGKTAFDLAGDRSTRDAFRVARSELGEAKWDWSAAHVPTAITKTEADRREQEEKEQEVRAEASRRRAELDRLDRESAPVEQKRPGGRVLGSVVETSAADKREQESRGLTPELRLKLERERRARAAEERMRKLANSNS